MLREYSLSKSESLAQICTIPCMAEDIIFASGLCCSLWRTLQVVLTVHCVWYSRSELAAALSRLDFYCAWCRLHSE